MKGSWPGTDYGTAMDDYDVKRIEYKQSLKMRPRKRHKGECSSSAGTGSGNDYDVFLNHRGPDVKGGFIAHLDQALRSVGLNPFLDKKSLVKGDPAFGSINAALEVAKVHVAVVSRGYAESQNCLTELVAMMRSRKPVIPVFYDVEPAELRRVDTGVFAAAFEKHRTRETAEQVQEWADALRKLADITGFVFRLSCFEGDEAELKQAVVKAILSLLPSHVPLQVESHLVGLEEQMRTCVTKLMKMSHSTQLLCLVGTGGIGKTSLAKVIYNHLIDKKSFQAMSFLEIGRNSPSSIEVGASLLSKLQRQLLWDLLHTSDNSGQQSYDGYWFPKISSLRPVLIVLDDIKDKDQFDKLICNTSILPMGSCIIVTSRDRHLLKLIVGKVNYCLYEVRPLGCEESQRLFNWHAFGDEEAPTNFKALANDISNACSGLPLALKVVGSNLFGKTSDEDRNCIWTEAKDALKGDPKVTNALKWSYDCLSKQEKLMFVDIACIFCGWTKQEALEIWQSCKKCSSCCGKGTPNTSLTHLIDKSLVVLECTFGEDSLDMHGLIQDMGQSIGQDEGSHLSKYMAIQAIEDKNQMSCRTLIHFENSNKVRTMNLANCGQESNFDFEMFSKMRNLHYLILDGCNVSGNLGGISKELRYIQWKCMPLTSLPPITNLSKLVSLDFSQSTKLADIFTESKPAFEACPNLQRLSLQACTSITTLPESIGCLSRLQYLNLSGCDSLQKLPTCIDQLTALEDLYLLRCERLVALPDSITAICGLRRLFMDDCSSLSELPTTFGLLTNLQDLHISLGTEWQAVAMGPRVEQLSALVYLRLGGCTDEVITVLDSLGTFRYLRQLDGLSFMTCPSMTKLPETIRFLTNLGTIGLWRCDKLKELPNSIGQVLKVLIHLEINRCSSLETLPDSLGALTISEDLILVGCASITQLPASIAQLSRLDFLHIQDCRALLSLPDSIRDLNALRSLRILDCGLLETLGLLRVLQGLRIWGCTSTTELPGSCLVVVDSDFCDVASFTDCKDWRWFKRDVKEVQVLEENDCGFLRLARDTESGRSILQRVHDFPCRKTLTVRNDSDGYRAHDIGQFNALMTLLLRDLTDDEESNRAIKLAILAMSNDERTSNELQTYLRVRECTDEGQLNALKTLLVRECTDKVVTLLATSRNFRNLQQLVKLEFLECFTLTKLPETIGLLTNLESLELWRCKEVQALPNSVGQLKVLTTLVVRECSCIGTLPDSIGDLKVLTTLELRECSSLQTLPDSLGALTSLQHLYIVKCTSITKLPTCIGHLSSLRALNIQDCGELQSVPDSLRNLISLVGLQISDCGASLEGLGLLRALQGLRIWGCTSITQLPESCLMVLDITFFSWERDFVWDGNRWNWIPLKVNEEQVLETNDCGFLRHVREDTRRGRLFLQRVYSFPCHIT